MPYGSRLPPALAALTLAFASPAALAWGSLLLLDAPPPALHAAVGPSFWNLPDYPGARATKAWLIPGLDLDTPGGFFASTDSGIGWNLSRRADLQFGPRLWPQFGRSAHDAPPGLGGVGNRLLGGVFANLAPLPQLLLQSSLLRGGATGHDGSQVEIGATSGLPIGADLLGIGIAATWVNRAWSQGYFGVGPQAAQASGLPVYAPGAGWQDRSLTLSFEHRFSAHWVLDVQWVAAHLCGGAVRSPIAQSDSQNGATLTLWHEF